MQKNKMEEWTATGLYPLRVSSISVSVAVAIFCFAAISSDNVFDDDRILMADSSSRMLPYNEVEYLLHY